MPTLFTDPRSGGIKKSSGVNVLPIVEETWAEVRDDSNPNTDWLLAGYHGNSKTEITIVTKGHGGLKACANILPNGIPVFGGVRLSSGKFVHFFYADDETTVMKKGRASMHKNGVLNVLEGCVDEIKIHLGMTEDDLAVSQLGSASASTSTSNWNKTQSHVSASTQKMVNKEAIKNDETHNDQAGPSPSAHTNNTTPRNFDSRIQKHPYESPSRQPQIAQNHHEHQKLEQKIKNIDINTVDSNQNGLKHNKNSNELQQAKGLSSPNYHHYGRRKNYSTTNTISHDGQENDKVTQQPKEVIDLPTENNTKPPIKESPTLSNHSIPYSELKGISDVTKLPPGVDPLNREASLSDEEFYQVFDMDKSSFYDLPTWKRVSKKKAKLLF